MADFTPLTFRDTILSDKDGNNKKKVFFLLFLSLLLHFFCLTGLYFFQGITLDRVQPPSISVDLVSFSSLEDNENTGSGREIKPEPEPSPPSEVQEEKEDVQEEKKKDIQVDKQPDSRELQAPEPVVDKNLEKEKKSVISSAPGLKEKPEDLDQLKPIKKKKKTSLKAETYQSEKVLDSARKSIEKTIEEKTEARLSDALDRLRTRVKKEGSQKESGLSGNRGSRQKGRKAEAIDLYNIELMYRIQENWVFNERLARADKDSEVRILIKILKSGEIRDIWYETRSGNRYLDESALKAIKKSSPLPRLPKGYASYDVGLIFTPSGLQ
ncbi:MAG: energy transducer TonB [Thermodesulfobacteriota bacterium]|nr:energy transducer TonB [Thermodesulfobacteriota bacterium]